MLEVPADSLALGVYVQCRFGGPGKVVTECDVLMDPVADGLNSCPPRRGATEQLPRKRRKVCRLRNTGWRAETEEFQSAIVRPLPAEHSSRPRRGGPNPRSGWNSRGAEDRAEPRFWCKRSRNCPGIVGGGRPARSESHPAPASPRPGMDERSEAQLLVIGCWISSSIS